MPRDFARFEDPPTDFFELKAWNGGEIYRNEEYLEMDHNGDKVLNKQEEIMEYLNDNFDFTMKLLKEVATIRVAGEE